MSSSQGASNSYSSPSNSQPQNTLGSSSGGFQSTPISQPVINPSSLVGGGAAPAPDSYGTPQGNPISTGGGSGGFVSNGGNNNPFVSNGGGSAAPATGSYGSPQTNPVVSNPGGSVVSNNNPFISNPAPASNSYGSPVASTGSQPASNSYGSPVSTPVSAPAPAPAPAQGSYGSPQATPNTFNPDVNFSPINPRNNGNTNVVVNSAPAAAAPAPAPAQDEYGSPAGGVVNNNDDVDLRSDAPTGTVVSTAIDGGDGGNSFNSNNFNSGGGGGNGNGGGGGFGSFFFPPNAANNNNNNNNVPQRFNNPPINTNPNSQPAVPAYSQRSPDPLCPDHRANAVRPLPPAAPQTERPPIEVDLVNGGDGVVDLTNGVEATQEQDVDLTGNNNGDGGQQQVRRSPTFCAFTPLSSLKLKKKTI